MIGTPGANTGGFGGGTPVPASTGHGSAAPGSPSQVPVAHSGVVASPELVGTVLSDRYRVLKKLGEGGMGSVYLAEHTTINKKLAIKVLSSEYSHKQDLVDRFLQEARAASMIEQENVVEITDFGSTPSGSVFFVMEFLNGEDLSRTIKSNGPLPWARVKPIMLQICAALTAAHDVGIIHRDMKPENCYRIRRGGSDDFIKVLDFGIAKVTSDDGEGKGLTRTGMIFGTPEYMSPEQAKGEKVDHRVDVYAVGVILYELLTGQVPFTADTFMGILTKHMFEAPPAPSMVAPDADIPPQVEAIILKALQKDREYRFQSMPDLAVAIKAVGTDSAAVSVVAERVAVPSTGETRYQTSTTGVPLATNASLPPAREKRGAGVLIGVAAFLLALGGAAAYLMLNDDTADAQPDNGAAAAIDKPATKKKDPEVTPPPEPDDDGGGTPEVDSDGAETPVVDDGSETPPTPTVAMITVSVPDIEGEVFSAADDALLGKTNEAFELPVGADEVGLYVRADGYEELELGVVPDGDKTMEAELTKERGGRRPGGRRPGGRRPGGRNGGRNGGTQSDSGGTQTDTGGGTQNNGGHQTNTNNGGSSPDLKDPFKNR